MLKFFRRPKIPLHIQFELACEAASVFGFSRVEEILQTYGYSVRHAKTVKKYLTFTSAQLLEYFVQNPKTCKRLFNDSGDKRYTPSTFITMNKKGKYFVGMLDRDVQEHDVETFDTLAEAVTDYVLFSLKLNRLKIDG